MIKKAGNIVLIVLLLFSTMGVTVYKHYCGAKYIKQTIGVLPNDCCGGDCNACHNESKQLKITDSFEANVASFSFKMELIKILNFGNFAFTLIIPTFQEHIAHNLFYKVKTCGDFIPDIENSTILLQVFRL